MVFETIQGQPIASLECDPAKERRALRDENGELCAVIVRTVMDAGQNRFRLCGRTKAYPDQRKGKDTGYYTWGEVKNSSGINVKFSMKLKGGSETKYVTETFGPSLFNWNTPRGFIIKQGKEACCRITYLGDSRGIVLAPNVDKCLMLCFAAIIEEMVEHRMR